jgi:predicted RND superfamily exporter protein
MITGISFNFHKGAMSWVSESSQWWQSMAIVVVFGLIVATFLTLVVVPTLYFIFERMGTIRKRIGQKVQEIYWKPFPYLAGQTTSEDN